MILLIINLLLKILVSLVRFPVAPLKNQRVTECDSLFLCSDMAKKEEKQGYVFSNVLTKMTTVDVICYKYKPLKTGELPLKIRICKDRKTRYINLGVSTQSELPTGANKSSYIDNFLDRAYNATKLTDGLNKSLYGNSEYAWFIQ